MEQRESIPAYCVLYKQRNTLTASQSRLQDSPVPGSALLHLLLPFFPPLWNRSTARAAVVTLPAPPHTHTPARDLGGLGGEHPAPLSGWLFQPCVRFIVNCSNWCLLDCTPLQVIQSCCEGRTPKETIENLLHTVTEEKTLPAKSLVKLLQAVRTAFPNLGLLLDNLQKGAGSPGTTGTS